MTSGCRVSLTEVQESVKIMETVTEVCHLPKGGTQIFGKSRQQDIVRARHIAMYIMRRHQGLSTTKIGAIFRRRHNSVLHAVRSMREQIKIYTCIRTVVNEVERRLGLPLSRTEV